MNCPESSVGTNYMYWFNPIGGTSSVDGVLPNMIPTSSGGAKDVGLIIKKVTLLYAFMTIPVTH